MAEVGKIYWGLYNNPSDLSNVLYLSGSSLNTIPGNCQDTGLWDQTIAGSTGWKNRTSFTWKRPGDSSSSSRWYYSVDILDEIKPIDCSYLFSSKYATFEEQPSASGEVYCNLINNQGYLDTENTTNMEYMFSSCTAEFTMSLLKTQNVENMSHMFMSYSPVGFDYTLERYSIDLSDFDTSKVTNMAFMFFSCRYCSSIDVSNFNTSNVTDMSYMFDGLFNIESLDVSSFNTSKVTTMAYMFEDCCREIEELDIGSFEIDSLTDSSSMFRNSYSGVTYKLKTIYTNPNIDWNSSTKLANSSNMFSNCSSLIGGSGTPYDSTKTNKAYAKIDGGSSNKGYFTKAQRTVSKTITGSGTLTGDGTYDYGTEVSVIMTPDSGNYSHSLLLNGTNELISDRLAPFTYKFNIKKNTSFAAEFILRQSYSLSVTQSGTSYTIEGTGTYRYLDNPTLIADLNEGLISFLGWFDGDVSVSTQNPYSFTMPDRDLSLLAKFGDTPFSDERVRQFILRNRNGELYKLTDKNSDVFISGPNGLGYTKDISTIRYGNSLDVPIEQYQIPKITGDLIFHNDDIGTAYQNYYDFVRFSVKKPIILWYKIPVSGDISNPIDNVYHIPVEITSVEKSEYSSSGAIASGIQFEGTGFWKHTASSLTENVVLNHGDLDTGIELTVQKSDSSSFDNPVITFSDTNGAYGISAFQGTFTKIYINTSDKNQKIILWNGSDTPLSDPFTYIDFDKSDGEKSFPFPKLKNGIYTTISLTYDGIGEETQSYMIIYDEEYVSV